MALKADIIYKSGNTGMPIVVFMHGFGGVSSDFITSTKERLANYNIFCLFVEMRGRNSSGGTQDCSAREIYDIYDAVEYVKTNYAAVVDANQVHIVGYSGGGGNAFACATKFPDYFNTIVSFFGISDYGYHPTDGWYNDGGNTTVMDSWIGGSPTTYPERYHARDHLLGVTNFTGGHLFMYHDDGDSTVKVKNSTNVKTAFDNASLTNYTYSKTLVSDSVRWLHGYPNTTGSPNLIQAEPLFIPSITSKTYAAWTVPTTGTIKVLGYIKTKRFTIWLGGLTEAATGAGLDEAATVAYNTTTGQYTITPLTGNMDVYIKQGALTANQSITGETTLTVT